MAAGKFEELFGRIGRSEKRTPVLEWNDVIFRAVGDQHRRGDRPQVFPSVVTDARQPTHRKIWIELLAKIGHGSEAGSDYQGSRFFACGQPCSNGAAQRFAVQNYSAGVPLLG